MERLPIIIGLAGVARGENEKALFFGRFFGIIILVAIISLAVQWHLEVTGKISERTSDIANFVLWLFFLVETLVLVKLVNDKRRYLKENWLNLFIIISGSLMLISNYELIVSLLRTCRIMLAVGLLIPWFNLIRQFLTDSRLSTTIAVAFIILTLSGIFIATIDPGVHSIEEGIWWAWVTISTVGYGDVVPESTIGRIFSVILILFGLGLFSVITANFAALLMQEKVEDVRKRQEEEHQDIRLLIDDMVLVQGTENSISKQLKEIQDRLVAMENKIDANNNHDK